ncbi:lipoyl synthase [Atractiella rhizophila]|nr:lipoyl synthase [Atractiella rhizophila]
MAFDWEEEENSECVGVCGNSMRLPDYLRTKIPVSESYNSIKRDLRGLGLNTVCEEARCPNIGQCWSGSKGEATATIMLMGSECTRACRFCSVSTSRTPAPLDPNEPSNVATAISRWGVGYIVMTSVDRDDLPDYGAAHFASTIRETKTRAPHILFEALTPDFLANRELVSLVANAGLSVFAHNVETVERLTPEVRDRRAGYRQSLRTLELAKETTGGRVLTKSSIMLGLGEEEEEVIQTLRDLRSVGVDVVTLGQYMRPTKRHMKVDSYVAPEVFEKYAEKAREMGFLYVASGPLVRSSFKAGELVRAGLEGRLRAAVEKNLNDLSKTRTGKEEGL